MRRTVAMAVLLTLATIALPCAAEASWQAGGSDSGYSRAETMPAGSAPAGSVVGRNATVSWTAVSLPGGGPVGGYVVRRYDAGGEEQVVGAGCSGIIAGLSCTEQAVPPGSWRYTVTPALQGWRGAESAPSSEVVVGAPALALSPSTLTSLPATLTGQITGFIEGQAVSFRLDDPETGQLLTGSVTPTPVPANGSASVSVTIPAEILNGAHTVYAVGDQGDVASAAITVAVPIYASAWDLRDASSGAEQSFSDPTAFPADELSYEAGWFSNAFKANRYIEWGYNSPLRAGLATSSVSFDFRFASAGGSDVACFYFDVISGGTVIGTHGSTTPGPATSPWCTDATYKLVSTALPEVTSTSIANGLSIKLYGYESGKEAIFIDAATISGTAAPAQSFTLYETTQVGRPATTPWPLAAGGDSALYTSAANWPGTFSASRYLLLTFPAYVPEGASLSSVSFVHSYRSSGGAVCWYFEVFSGGSLIGTHGSPTEPVSCNSSTTSFVTDTVALPEVTTAAQANDVAVKIYVDNAGLKKSQHDLAELSITYAP